MNSAGDIVENKISLTVIIKYSIGVYKSWTSIHIGNFSILKLRYLDNERRSMCYTVTVLFWHVLQDNIRMLAR